MAGTTPSTGAENVDGPDRAEVVANVKSSLDALKVQIARGVNEKVDTDLERKALTTFADALLAAKKAGKEPAKDPAFKALLQKGIEEMPTEVDEKIVALFSGLDALAKEVGDKRPASKQTQLNLTAPEKAAGKLLNVLDPKMAPVIAALATKFKLKPADVEKMMEFVRNMVSDMIAGAFEKFGKSAGELRFKKMLAGLDPDNFDSKEQVLVADAKRAGAGGKSKLKSAWMRVYKRNLASKAKGKPISLPSIEDAFAFIDRKTLPPRPEQDDGQKSAKTLEIADASKFTSVNEKADNTGRQLSFKKPDQVKLDDSKIFSAKVDGATVTGLKITTGSDGAKKVEFSTGGSAKASEPLGEIITKIAQSDAKEINIGTITLNKLEKV